MVPAYRRCSLSVRQRGVLDSPGNTKRPAAAGARESQKRGSMIYWTQPFHRIPGGLVRLAGVLEHTGKPLSTAQILAHLFVRANLDMRQSTAHLVSSSAAQQLSIESLLEILELYLLSRCAAFWGQAQRRHAPSAALTCAHNPSFDHIPERRSKYTSTLSCTRSKCVMNR